MTSFAEKLSMDCNDKGYPTGKFGVRHLVAVVVFFGFFNDFTLRTNLSVALMAMINNTNTIPQVLHNGTKCTENVENQTELYSLDQTGVFNWNHKTQGIILGSFFYGYIITQVPGGLLSKKYGSKRLFGYGILLTAIAALFIPLAARFGAHALIAIRVLQGLAEGVTSPAIHNLWGQWAPRLERSQLIAFSYAGIHFGTFVSIPVSGILIRHNVAGGWPSVFYLFGSLGCIWWLLWIFIVSDSPKNHWFISKEEREYIEDSIEINNEDLPVPWMSVMKSKPMWAINIAHFCSNWSFYTMLTCLPMYIKDILHFDIQKNALVSGLPYLLVWLVSIAGGCIADYIRRNNYLSTGNTRKLMNSMGFILPSIFLIAINYVGCDKTLAVVMVVLGIGTSGFAYSGFLGNHLDLAPSFAGVLFALTNATATIPGMLGPYIVGLITNEQHTSEQWKLIFSISVAIYFFGCLVYLIFGSGEIQPWAYGSIKRKSQGQSFDFDTDSTDKTSKPTMQFRNNQVDASIQI